MSLKDEFIHTFESDYDFMSKPSLLSRYDCQSILDVFTQLPEMIQCNMLLYFSTLNRDEFMKYKDTFLRLLSKCNDNEDSWMYFISTIMKQMLLYNQDHEYSLMNNSNFASSLTELKYQLENNQHSNVSQEMLSLYMNKYDHSNSLSSICAANKIYQSEPLQRNYHQPNVQYLFTKKMQQKGIEVKEKKLEKTASSIKRISSVESSLSKRKLKNQSSYIERESKMATRSSAVPITNEILAKHTKRVPISVLINSNKQLLESLLPIKQPRFFDSLTIHENSNESIVPIHKIYYPAPIYTFKSFLFNRLFTDNPLDIDRILKAFLSHKTVENLQSNEYEFIMSEHWTQLNDTFSGELEILKLHFDTFEYEIFHKVVETVPD